MNLIVLGFRKASLDEGYLKIEEKIKTSSPKIKGMFIDESTPISKWMKNKYFHNVITILTDSNTDNNTDRNTDTNKYM